MKNLITKYNKQNTLLVISSYPKKQEIYSKNVCAVASFTKNTIHSLKNTDNYKKIVVFTMIIDKEETYEEDEILVIRCFKRNKPLTYFNLIKKLRLFNNAPKTLIEFEFSSFGGTKSTLALLPLIWLIFLSGKKITLVIHQVLLDIHKISGHTGISSKKLISLVFNPAIRLYYKLLSYPASSIVVLEDNLKSNLSKIVNPEKITVIPHGVPSANINGQTKLSARKELGIDNEVVILYFGYLTWYKGVDFIIRTFLKRKTLNGKRLKLIIAGGPSFTQKKKSHYQTFLNRIQSLMKKAPSHIDITGFVDEKDIPKYFLASDLVILPYRAFISSSGPLSFALSFKKPFLLSENLGKLLKSSDVRESMEESGLSKRDLLFELKHKDLIAKIKSSLNEKQYKKLEEFSVMLAEKRSFKRLSQRYSEVLNNEESHSKISLKLPNFNYRFRLW